ncbi:MAG: hypothetical protein QOD26_2301 [Betaproteobacteria bacterium]|jgi:uncharacterized protein (TIGR00255 family)|nr:hypothetical protein [Betaproteobacteria bacterium]
MIQSMTGYAASTAESARGTLALELRSVNSRFLDVQMRIAEELRALEPTLRELIAERLARGKVDCRLFVVEGSAPAGAQRLNEAALGQLKTLAEQARKAFPDAGSLRVADVLRWPGVVTGAASDERELRALAEKLCRRVLDELVAARAREGAKLAAAIGERAAAMRKRVEAVAPLMPQSVAAYREKLTERLREAIGSADDERVRAEVAVFAQKVDVDEELTRLRTHLTEVERVLKQGGAAGKRLDFLAQELNREANTLASKAASAAVSEAALELKLLVEQMREQVQNIE